MLRFVPALAAAAMLAAVAMPASATEWIICSNADDTASIGVLAGGLDFAQFSRATLSAGGKDWATHPDLEPGEPLLIAQSFWNGTELLIDLADTNSETILAELRAYTISSEDGDAKGGVLSIPGHGVWAVTCEGP